MNPAILSNEFRIIRRETMGKRMTIKDIAQLAGVSVGAVSTAFSKKASNVHLSDATREKIFRIAEQYHYIPNITARSMQSQKSYLLGFFYRTNNSFLQTNLLRGIRKACYEYDYDIIVYPCDSLEEEAHNLQTLHVNQLDGIITIPILEDSRTNEALYRSLVNRGIPLVQLLADFWEDLPSIVRDYREIGFNAVKILYEKGHQHIGMLLFSNYTNRKIGIGNALLADGVQQGIAEFGLKLEIFTVDSSANRSDYIPTADAATEKILQMPKRPTALITASGLLAYGAYSCLKRNGINVPNEISLLACGDDSEQFGLFTPNLSYFPVELEKIGYLSAKYCLEKEKTFPLKQLIGSNYCEGEMVADIKR